LTEHIRRGLERNISTLKPHERNPRTHSRRQLEQIAESIKRFGFTNPVLIDDKDRIIAGHGRVAAARTIGLETVPVILISGMSEADRRAYVIADNRLAELAGWDENLLRLELGSILEFDESYDLTLTGYEGAELEALLRAPGPLDGDETPVEVDEDAPVVTRAGDIWELGKHRIICGDARDASVYSALLQNEKAEMVFTDPPYNVRVNGHICGLGKVKHDEFEMASGEMSQTEFEDFLADTMTRLVEFSTDGSIHYVCMDWRHMWEMLVAGRKAYTELKNLIVWNKDNGGMGAFYRSKHELIFAFKNGTAKHINNFELGQHGRYRTNVWDCPGISSMSVTRSEELAMHPTVKPIALVAEAMIDCSRTNGIVLDAFSGSGTTIMAAEKTGRRARAIELAPRYVDTAVRRWQKETGNKAVLQGSKLTFDDMEELVS